MSGTFFIAIALISLQSAQQSTGSKALSRLRKTTYTKCQEDSANKNGLIGDSLTVPSPASCATKCLENTECSSFIMMPGSDKNQLGCQLSRNSNNCSNLEPAPGETTYMIFIAEICEKGIPELPAMSPNLYPLAYTAFETEVFSRKFLCDTTTEGGGWILVQRRHNGLVEFYRGWEDYKAGFGTFDTEFWIGLETLHSLTSSDTFELRVELKYDGRYAYAQYDTFYVGAEEDNYRMSVGTYNGTAGDDLTYHSGQEFSTHDRDNDASSAGNCAKDRIGAWWYNFCANVNSNGKWGEDKYKSPEWSSFTFGDAATFTEMKIRRVNV